MAKGYLWLNIRHVYCITFIGFITVVSAALHERQCNGDDSKIGAVECLVTLYRG